MVKGFVLSGLFAALYGIIANEFPISKNWALSPSLARAPEKAWRLNVLVALPAFPTLPLLTKMFDRTKESLKR